jgi:hypothetical protein
MLFGYPVASLWMSCCGIPTRKLRIVLMKFLVMCVYAINCENINVLRYIILFLCGVIKVTQLGIFSRSYCVLIMGFLARSEKVIYSYHVLYIN